MYRASFKTYSKFATFLAVGTLSLGLSWLVETPKATAQTCNAFGCSAPGAGSCNPFGCPNPGGGNCTPFGCPAGVSGSNNNTNMGNSSGADFGDFLRGVFGNSSGNSGNSGNDDSRSSRRSSRSSMDRLLAGQGLVRTECSPGVAEIWVSLEDSVCAVPTAQYPAGRYYFDERGFTITPVGGSNTATQPATQPPYVYQTPAPVAPPYVHQPTASVAPPYVYQTTTPVAPPSYGYSTLPVPAPAASPAILMVGNPSQPVSPDISAQISASLAGRGLTPVSCSLNPGVTVLVDQYMACAYPTPSYPAGRYTLR
ncbi:MAG: hypothetical protein HY785_08930 [Oscillatoriophycideae cyanobacterium NC_groundwater_1537_Pr4_S-0.65um_50_18]|nr:hypothetical protein [Oscillatoriophycideae cyanobacterium NC_groundwater_1537_Pr4_S-0.65um_50_18]